MGVQNMTYDTAAVEAALFRSTGIKYGGMQYGPAIAPDKRAPTNSGKGVGHVYMHDADQDPITGRNAPMSKSAYENHTVMVAVLVEALASTKGKAALKWLDDHPGSTDGLWLHGPSAIPVTGDWYGYAQGGNALKKISKVSINIRAHGDALFITSSYPEAFQA
jgi:hypothetical protein